jgi:hypothetical protein
MHICVYALTIYERAEAEETEHFRRGLVLEFGV